MAFFAGRLQLQPLITALAQWAESTKNQKAFTTSELSAKRSPMTMFTRRTAMLTIGIMFGASKSYQIRATTVSYGFAMPARPESDGVWQKLNLSTSLYLTVNASINGAAIPGIIDTGATRSVINAKWAQRLGLSVFGKISAAAVTGQVTGTLYHVSTLGLGNVVVHNVNISSFDVSAVERSLSRELPLVIGQDLLANAILEIQFPNDRARFKSTLERKSMDGFKKFSVTLGNSNLPYFAIGLESETNINAIIDLGSNVLCSMSESFAREHGLLDDRLTSTTLNVGVDGETINRVFSLRRLAFGPFVLYDVPVCAISNWNFSQPVNLGWPSFAAFYFTLDAKREALWLAADSDRLKQMIPRDRSGIGANRLPDRLLVRHVSENSPAAIAGLRDGDEIVSINDRQVDVDYPPHNERQGEKPAGTRLKMALADGRILIIILADYF